ncbi:MAG TPA: PKD domain-containing protein [Actinophytocola sp.]|uniref:PKD domain-containing protein n=1 Tax=Actinophytocola sp. TaxID=1872138 RepID=UPI002DDD8B52|nr:PKD domain-containing protein [Actinophytocola sp.]HEV2779306.1 PKD domain-containing protein [Actinophytocola sp.]
MIPTEEGPGLSRAPYAVLGVAGIVVATVFAAVATLASNPAEQAQPLPVIPGPVSTSGTTSRTGPVIPVPTSPGTEAAAASTTTGQSTTTTTRPRPTTTTTTTTEPAPPPPPPPPPRPQPPVARFTPTCPPNGLSCTFDATGAHDPDGRIIYYAWAFGDDSGDEGSDRSRTSHTYAAPGTYTVTLLVMDNSGTVSRATREVTVPRGG